MKMLSFSRVLFVFGLIPLMVSCGLVRGMKTSSSSNESGSVVSTVVSGITYSATSYNFLSYNQNTLHFEYGTTGVPTVTGGVITNCTLTHVSGAINNTPQIDHSTCEVRDYRDNGFGACGQIHDTSTGAYYNVTPYINGEAATPVQLLFYITADDSGPC